MRTAGYLHIKNEIRPLPHTIHKNDLKRPVYLNVRAKTIKLLGVNFHDLGLGSGFLIMTINVQITIR